MASILQSLNPLCSCHQGSDSPSSSTPEEADTEDDGQAVSTCRLGIYSLKEPIYSAAGQLLVFLTCGMTCSLCQSHTGSESSSNSRKEMLPKPITIVTSESSSTCFVRSEEFSFGSSHAVTTQTPAQVTPTPSSPSPSSVLHCDKMLKQTDT